jgi:hypothetical protein
MYASRPTLRLANISSDQSCCKYFRVFTPSLASYFIFCTPSTLHEAEVSHVQTPNRGIQLYIQCVQIEVTGSGTVQLPEGVSFPGAYKYTDPGIVYNVSTYQLTH